MKRILIILGVIALLAIALSSCKSVDCPAYSEVQVECPVC